MPSITLNPTVSSYQYENSMFYGQKNCSPLPVYYHQDDHSYSISDLVINIFSASIDLSLLIIKNVILELPLCTFHSHNQCLNNELIITSYCTSSTHTPYAISRISHPISPASFSGSSLFLNVTPLLHQWNPRISPVYQLIISIQRPNLYFEIVNNAYFFPKIHIEYEDYALPMPTPEPEPTPNTPSMLYLLETKCTQMMVQSKEAFIFDPIDPNFISTITYDAKTGYFTFTKPGIYYIHWILNIRGSAFVSAISIGLFNVTAGTITSFVSPCVLPGQVYGQHALRITKPPIQYALINNSEGCLQLCNMSTQSSLIMFEV